ncbi:MAG: lamin tail domain-containing protein [Patescibacteria group bacterium]
MLRRGLFLLFTFFCLVLVPIGKTDVLSYDTNVAHPNIVELAANVYNEKFNNQLTKEEIGWIKQGAIDEDTPTRWMNHFYDPVRAIGLKGLYLSSKEWAVSPYAQTNYSLGDRSWQRAISDFKKGRMESAYKELGHVLHLLADATVPAHTRDDIHVLGDSYEQFVKNNWHSIYGSLQYFFVKAAGLSSAFDALAGYSNNNFYSDHTVEDPAYQKISVSGYETTTFSSFLPIITRLAKATLPNGDKYNLYALATTDWKLNLDYKFVNSSQILIDYTRRLLPKAIGYSAGVIKLFFEEVKKEKVVDLPTERVSNLGKVDQVIGSVVQGAENVYYSAKDSVIPVSPVSTSFVYAIGLPSTPVSVEPPPAPIIIPEPTSTPTPTPTPTPTTTPDPTPTSTSDPTPSSTPPVSREVVINEVAWAGTASSYSSDEWLELYNNTDADIDLTDWKILINDNPITISKINNKIITAGGYYLLERTSDSVISDIAADEIYTGGLANGGAKLELINPAGVIIDEVDATSSWFAGDTVKYRTMERVAASTDGSDPDNWQSSIGSRLLGKNRTDQQVYGSPRQSNFGYIVLDNVQEDTIRTLTAQNNPYLLGHYVVPVGMTLQIASGTTIQGYVDDAKMDVSGKLKADGASFSHGDYAVFSDGGQIEILNSSFTNFSNAISPITIKHSWPNLSNLSFSGNVVNLPYLESVSINESFAELNQDVIINILDVSASSTLKIWPGTNIYLSHYTVVTIDGSIIAEGTAASPIKILATSSSLKWGNLRFYNSSSSFDHVEIKYGNLLPFKTKDTDGMIIANNSDLKFNHATIWDSRPPGNTILATDSILNIANSQIGNTDKYPDNGVPGITTAGIKANHGALWLDNVKFKNLLEGIDGGSWDNGLPTVHLQNMSTTSFENVDYRWQPSNLCSF